MSRTLSDALSIVGFRGLLRLAQIFSFFILARVLTPAEFGWFGIATSAIALSSILFSLGLRQSFAFQIGQGRSSPGEALATAGLLLPLMAAAGTIAAVLTTPAPESMPGADYYFIIALGVSATIALLIYQGVYLGTGELRAFNRSEATPRLLLLLFSVAIWWLSIADISIALWGNSISFALVALFLTYSSVKKYRNFRPNFSRIFEILRYGLAFALNLFLITLCARICIFLVEHYHDAELAGFFFAATRVNEVFLEIATAIGLAAFSNSVRSKPTNEMNEELTDLTSVTFWIFSVAGVGIAFIAPFLMKHLAGTEYQQAGPALSLMALGLGASAGAKIIYPYIAGRGRPLFGTPVIAFGLIATLSLAFLLIPRQGLTGAALSFVGGQFVIFLGYIIVCWRALKVPPIRFFIPSRSSLLNFARAPSVISRRIKLLFKRSQG